MKLSDETVDAIRKLQKRYPQKRSALIPSLHLAQKEVGYLPVDIQKEVAALFDLDKDEVRAIASFYDMFFEEPVGKHIIHVCKNASCMLRGCDHVIECLKAKLKDKTDITLIESECLGACDRAPMMIVGEKVVGPVSVDHLDSIIEEASNG